MARLDIERGFRNIIKNWFERLNVERKELAERYGYTYEESKDSIDNLKTAKVRYYAINNAKKKLFVAKILDMGNAELFESYEASLMCDCTAGLDYDRLGSWYRLAIKFELEARLKACGFLEAK